MVGVKKSYNSIKKLNEGTTSNFEKCEKIPSNLLPDVTFGSYLGLINKTI